MGDNVCEVKAVMVWVVMLPSAGLRKVLSMAAVLFSDGIHGVYAVYYYSVKRHSRTNHCCYSAKRQYYSMRDIVVGVPIVPLH